MTPYELLAVIVLAWAAILIGFCLLLTARAPREAVTPPSESGA